MRSIQPVIDLFLNCKTWKEFEKTMILRGYIRDYGSYKYVFIHPRKKYVAKIVHGIDEYPHPKSRVSQFYLYPPWQPFWRGFPDWRNHRGRFFKVGLIFQHRVDTEDREKTLRELKVRLRMKKARWVNDAHDGNVGRYRGKPVIIDY